MKEICIRKDDIKKFLPHRGPMLLLDEIILSDDDSVVGKYYFRGDEWFFQGHFPEEPIVPGVILCEIMAQASCGLAGNKWTDKTTYLTGINQAKFKKTVHPGDECRVMVKLLDQKGCFYFIGCKLQVKGQLCAESELILYMDNKLDFSSEGQGEMENES